MIPIYRYGEVPNELLLARRDTAFNVQAPVAAILADVLARGDAALRDYTERIDGVRLERFEVSAAEFDEALASVEPAFLDVLREAAANIRAYHEKQKRESGVLVERDGVILGMRYTPIEKVGLYVPNGTAPYPSTVLMDAIPAKIAGCPELVMVTPPSRDGKVDPGILAAARVAGIDRVFKVGGAQAIAALAYGTESIPAVYKIVGPGNAYVAEAKKQVFGRVAIDVVAGPSEVLLVATRARTPACSRRTCWPRLSTTGIPPRCSSRTALRWPRPYRRRSSVSLRFFRGGRSPAPPSNGTERSSSPTASRRPSRSATRSRPSTSASVCASPSPGLTKCAAQAPSSSATTPPKPSGTIWPDRTTPCRPAVSRSSPRPSAWTTS